MAHKKAELSGRIFGRLTVLRESSKRGPRNQVQWECSCSCGKIVLKSSNSLLKRTNPDCSCGCAKREKIGKLGRERDKRKPGTAMRDLLASYRANARRRGLSWELTTEQFQKLTSSSCFYTGREPSAKTSVPEGDIYIYNGIDRLDSSIGYTPENCVPCCSDVNYLKNDMPFVECVALLDEIHDYMDKVPS